MAITEGFWNKLKRVAEAVWDLYYQISSIDIVVLVLREAEKEYEE